MNLTDIIVITIVIVIAALAAYYIYKEKKSGKKCIGCPYSNSCSSKNSCGKSK